MDCPNGIYQARFPDGVGQAGGYGATFLLMQSLGLLPTPEARAQEPLKGNVVILGGGIAGLVAAYQLTKSGHQCILLEADGLGGAGYVGVIQPDRRLYFAGDHASQLVSWQEGAALSAHRAIGQIGQRLGKYERQIWFG